MSIYKPLLELINKRKWAIDNIFISLINKYKLKALVFYPNLIMADRTTSDIQPNIKRNQGNHLLEKYNTRLRWNINSYNFLSIYDYENINKTKILSNLCSLNKSIIHKSDLNRFLRSIGLNINVITRITNFLMHKKQQIKKTQFIKFIRE